MIEDGQEEALSTITTAVAVPKKGGDGHALLSRALREAGPNGVVKLSASVYELNKPLVIHYSVTLAGLGLERTLLKALGPHPILIVASNVTVQVRDMDLFAANSLKDSDDSTLVVCSRGRLEMTRCHMSGATGQGRGQGAGARIERAARFRVEDCLFTHNQSYGIAALEGARVRAQSCLFESNGVGIAAEEQAEVHASHNTLVAHRGAALRAAGKSCLTATGNRCKDGHSVAILLRGWSEGHLRRNICQDNRGDGVRFEASAFGTLRDTSCEGNANGIVLNGRGKVTVAGNICSHNIASGIDIGPIAEAKLSHNTCARNGSHGIAVFSDRVPELEENTCRSNNSSGIALLGKTNAEVRRNTCTGNTLGVSVREQAVPTLSNNSVVYNAKGILVADNASGQISLNTCYGNHEYCLKVTSTVSPEVQSNTFQGLVTGHIRVQDAHTALVPVEKWRQVPVQVPRQLKESPGGGLFHPRFSAMSILIGPVAALVLLSTIKPAMYIAALLVLLPGALVLVLCDYLARSNRARLLSHGAWALGKVTGVHRDGTLVVCSYTPEDGQERTFSGQATNRLLAGEHQLGEQIAVLYDPAKPERALVPSLFGELFALPPQATDNRPEQPTCPEDWPKPEPVTDGEEARIEVKDASRSRREISRLKWLWSPERLPVCLGHLVFSATSVQSSMSGSASVVVDLSEPFVTALSVWCVSNDAAELTVELRQRGAPANVPSIRFKVELAQSYLSRSLPKKQSTAPYISARDFPRLWSILQFHASAVGEVLDGVGR